MKFRRAGIRTLKTWCVYNPENGVAINFCSIKKAAVEVARTVKAVKGIRCIVVPMKGTYAASPRGGDHS